MSFPTSPTNGQTSVVNGITYSYSTSTTAWTRVAAQVTATTYLNITNNTGVTSTTTGALQVIGGVGVGGGMYVGGTVTATTFVGAFSGTASAATNIAGGAKDQIPYQTGAGATTFNSGLTFNGTTFTATNIIVPGVTNSTSTTTGALQIAGGVAIGKDLYIGGTLTIAGASGGDIDLVGGDIIGVGRITANTGTFTTTDVSSTLGVTSTNTGALTVAGGIGVGGGIYAGGVITATNIFIGPYAVSTASSLTIQSLGVGQGSAATINFSTGLSASVTSGVATVLLTTSTLMTTAVNLAGGTAGYFAYQTGAGATAFASTASMYVNGSVSSQNLFGGSAGSLPYQSGSGATTFLAGGSAQQHLVYGTGNTLVWQSTSTFSGGTASNTAVANQSVTVTGGGLGVTGDSYFSANLATGGALRVNSTAGDTGTNTSNSLYVAGGAWIDKTLVVQGDVTFKGNAVFQGTTTNVISSNTYVTDNIINIHVPPTGVNGQWAIDDGKDIGLRFHYYAGADNNAALVLNNSTKYLTWYETGAENANGVFTTATFGTFQTGRVFAGSAEGTYSTATGALRVFGGIGVNGGGYFGGIVTATTFVGSFSGTASKATNIAGGSQGQLPYQSAADTTAFVSSGTTGQFLQATTNGAPAFTSTGSMYVNGAVNAQTLFGGVAGSLHYQSATGVTAFTSGTTGQILVATTNAAPVYTGTGSIYVNSSVFTEELRGGTAGQLVYQSAANTTDFVGPGTAGQILVSGGAAVPVYTSTGSIYVNGSVSSQNIFGGAKDQIPYQSAAGATTFNSGLTFNGTTFTATNIIVPGVTNATSTLTGALQVAGGLAVGKDLYIGGTLTIAGANGGDIDMGGGDITGVGKIVANTGTFTTTNVTSTVGVTSTNTGALQVAGGVGVGGGMFVGGVITATNVFVGGYAVSTASSLTIQSLGVGQGTAATINFSTGLSATVSSNVATILLTTSTLMTTAVNLAGGSQGQIHYQSAAGATAFASSGTTGQFLQATTNGAPAFTSTASMYVGNAAVANILNPGNTSTQQVGYAANILGNGVANGSLLYQSAANTTAFLAQGTAGWLLVSQGSGSAPAFTTTASVYVNSAVNANNIIGGSTNQIPYQSGAGATTFGSGLTYNGTTFTTGNISVTGNTDATSTTTGAFKVVGGAGIGGNLFVGGSAYLTGDLYVDGTSFTVNSNSIATGDKTLTLSTGSSSAALAANAGLQIGSTSTPYASWLYDGSAYWVSAGSSGGGIKANATTGASSTTTGALVVAGGAGFGGNLFVGGVVTATTFFGALTGTVTTATNLAGGTAGYFAYQTAPGATSFASTASMYVGNAVSSQNLLGGTAGYFAYQTAAGATAFASTASMYVGNAVNSQNLLGGAAGSISYQTGAGATAFLAGGTAGQFLRYSGSSAPVWSSTGTFSGGTASSSTVATQSVAITSGGLGVTGASYFSTDVGMGGELNVSGHIVGGGVRSSSTSTVPANATIGDIWYNTSNDTMYRYTNDGTTSYWVDITGPAIANGSASYITMAAFKAVVAASTSFADFQSRVAAL